MKILLVSHYFPPEIGAPQARLSEMAASWVKSGHEVTVLTGMPNHPTGIIPSKYQGAVVREEFIDGYKVIRTWLYATPNEGFVKKTLGHLSFMITSILLGITKVGRPDIVIVSSPTFFSIFSAWVISKVKRAKLIVEIRDLWPAIFVELGVLTNKTIIKILEALELCAYRVSDAVVVVTEGFLDNLVSRGVPREKITVIRNGVDLDKFGATPCDLDIKKELGASRDDIVVLYIGAHGISHGLVSIAKTALLLKDKSNLHFAFVGEGAAKKDLIDYVENNDIQNVTFLPGQPRERVPLILGASDICLVPLRDVPLFTSFIPSKIFEYLASKKAVIGSLSGEPAKILTDSGAVVVPPENPELLAEAIKKLSDSEFLREAMGKSGRSYVEENFDRTKLASDYLALMERITGF
ncbi:MAG: glycosyltransferase family 4 protein [Acidimicrobiales bacterium]|nr:glycosyltransferase family 4 protein [Acidimicrobiales bacterium]